MLFYYLSCCEGFSQQASTTMLSVAISETLENFSYWPAYYPTHTASIKFFLNFTKEDVPLSSITRWRKLCYLFTCNDVHEQIHIFVQFLGGLPLPTKSEMRDDGLLYINFDRCKLSELPIEYPALKILSSKRQRSWNISHRNIT